jgi:hypothetical protein
MMWPLDFVVEYAREQLADRGTIDRLLVSADAIHKMGASGGMPYAVDVAAPRVDGFLYNEPHHLLFVDYLRLSVLEWAGFPGLSFYENSPNAEVATLRQGLVRF